MKYFNEKHEAIITSEKRPVTSAATRYKSGDIVPHKDTVTVVVFHQFDRGNYRRVELDRQLILDLAKHIEEIESQPTVDIAYDDLPF